MPFRHPDIDTHALGWDSHAVKCQAITPSDSTVYDPPLRWLWVTTGGDLAFVAVGDTSPVTITVADKTELVSVAIKKVMNTNTTAASIVGGY